MNKENFFNVMGLSRLRVQRWYRLTMFATSVGLVTALVSVTLSIGRGLTK